MNEKRSGMKKTGPEAVELIKSLQQQVASLERKVDILISRQAASAAPRPAAPQTPAGFAQRPAGAPAQTPFRQPEAKQDAHFRERVLHKAVCADCSKPCEVPFKPSGDRPVYCKECFAKRRNGVGQARPAPSAPPASPAKPALALRDVVLAPSRHAHAAAASAHAPSGAAQAAPVKSAAEGRKARKAAPKKEKSPKKKAAKKRKK